MGEVSCEPAAAGIAHSRQQHRAQDPAHCPTLSPGLCRDPGAGGAAQEGTPGTSRGHLSIRPCSEVSVHSWPWGQSPFRAPPAPWAPLAHLFMPTLVAIDYLAGWQVTLTEVHFPSTLTAIQRAGIHSL